MSFPALRLHFCRVPAHRRLASLRGKLLRRRAGMVHVYTLCCGSVAAHRAVGPEGSRLEAAVCACSGSCSYAARVPRRQEIFSCFSLGTFHNHRRLYRRWQTGGPAVRMSPEQRGGWGYASRCQSRRVAVCIHHCSPGTKPRSPAVCRGFRRRRRSF